MRIVMAELLKPFIDHSARGGGKYPSVIVVSCKGAMYAFPIGVVLWRRWSRYNERESILLAMIGTMTTNSSDPPSPWIVVMVMSRRQLRTIRSTPSALRHDVTCIKDMRCSYVAGEGVSLKERDYLQDQRVLCTVPRPMARYAGSSLALRIASLSALVHCRFFPHVCGFWLCAP